MDIIGSTKSVLVLTWLFTKIIRATHFVRSSSSQGVTLIELLISIIIIGILSALGLSTFYSMVDKARYSEAAVQMDALKSEIQFFYLETGFLPRDRLPNIKPDGVPQFPISGVDNIPFNSQYDYDNWRIGQGKCYVQITFFGKDNRRNSPTGFALYPESGLYFHPNTDDYIMSLGIFSEGC